MVYTTHLQHDLAQIVDNITVQGDVREKTSLTAIFVSV